MKYQPKILVNNTKKTIEFMCNRVIYIFEPGEKKPLEGFAAYHALKETNTGLTEVGEEKEINLDVPLEEMSWKDLRTMEDKNGKKIYEMGMNRKELIEAIKKCL